MAHYNGGGDGGKGTVPMPLSSTSCSGGSAGSPLLDRGQALSYDPTICQYCNKKFRKIGITYQKRQKSQEVRYKPSATIPGTLPWSRVLPISNFHSIPCAELSVQPRVLDCLHSMCEDCVIAQLGGDIENANKHQRHHPHFGRASTDFEFEQHINNLRPTPPGVVRCPMCSQETHIGNDIMFVNLLMLLDFVRIREIGLNGRGDERICGACKSEEAAVANCLHCCSDLCNKCVQAHHDIRMFDGHKVMMFSDLDQPSADEFTKSEAEFKLFACTKYRADFIAVCFSCDELLCKDCEDSGEHYAYKWSFLNGEVDILCRKTLQELGQQAQQKGKATLDARESIPYRKELLHLSSNKCREKIEEAFVYYVHVLSEVKAQLLAELEKNRDEKEEYLDSLYKKIDMQTSKLQDALRYTNCLLEKGTVTELCLNKNKVRQQLKLLIHSMPDANAEVDLDFDSPTKAEFKKKLESIVGAIKCRVTGLPKDAKGLNLLTNEQQPTKMEGLSLSDMKHAIGAGGHFSAVASPIWDSANKSTSMIQQRQAILAAAYQQQQQQQNPGTIGMERRMMRNSNGTSIGGGGQSYLSGDSGNFSTSDMTLSSPISNSGGGVGGMIGAGVGVAHNHMADLHASSENFGMGLFGADSFPGFRTPTGGGLTSPDAMVMGGLQFGDPTNPMFPDTNNYLSGSQSKLWAGIILLVRDRDCLYIVLDRGSNQLSNRPRLKMSRSSSSSSDTSMPNTKATRVRKWHHRLRDPSVFQYITHDSTLEIWHCGKCNRRSFQIFEFAMGGKTDHWGRYLRHQSKEKRHVVNIDKADVQREFKLMRGRGQCNVFYYNCIKHWAEEFVGNILAKTRGEDEICGCLQFHFRAPSIKVHRNLRDYVKLVRFECSNGWRENMIISFLYTELGKGTRVVPSGMFLNDQFKLDKVSAVVDGMHKAFTDGVRFPVLKVFEYHRAAFFVWLVQCLLLLFLPHHFAKSAYSVAC
ncbi:hypothetical protein niasHT_001040 [Heterodera trifolii]|uniref:B box-type domain-containing protein n=1 Tax=Heterodera trifolii TaxID=157864 RepID=A0ABD2LMU3_9BILA